MNRRECFKCHLFISSLSKVARKSSSKNLVADVTDAVTKNTGAPAEHVHVVLSEMRKDRYSVGGVLKSDEK